jgi:hypothetical protein
MVTFPLSVSCGVSTPMKRMLFAATALALTVVAPVAAKPGDNAISIAATPAKVVFSKATVISGQLTGTGNAGVSVQLEGLPAPYTSGYKPVGAPVTTDPQGHYTISVSPQLSTRYRVTAKAKPTVTSGETTVAVALKVGMRASDKTPKKGQKVHFRGSVWPAHDGKTASLQRRTSAGWKTVSTATLVAATPVNGVTRSTYSFTRKIKSTARYRVFVASGDADHVDGRSRARRLRVH